MLQRTLLSWLSMRFASSRLLTAGVLTGAFVLHSACGGSVDLNFVGASGGGTSGGSGGSKAGKGGAGSSKGGANAAGDGSDGGTGNSATAGADQGGAPDNAGGGGNLPGAAGEGGTGGCTSNPEICDDGIDNDCDDLVDCPLLISAFPENNKAAAGADVELTFAPTADGTFQCRYGKPAEIESALWFDCPGPVVTPIADADSTDAAQDGLKLFQVRLDYGDTFSDVVEWTAYTHHSMHGVPRCAPKATDQAYFDFAATLLSAAGTFGATARLKNPFISIAFNPPPDAWVNVSDSDGLVEPLSLRKRFVRDPTDHYLLLTRVYESRGSAGYCDAAAIFVHDHGMGVGTLNSRYKILCDALVFNKKGAGVCLRVTGANVELAYTNNTTWFDAPRPYDGDVDNLLWRDLKRNNQRGVTRYFSPKCSGDPSCVLTNLDSDYTLYLPDAELFN